MLDTNEKAIEFYKDRLQRYGYSPEGMGWDRSSTHYYRLEQAKDMLALFDNKPEEEGVRILDVGCGYGLVPLHWDLEDYSVKYLGVDLVREYVAEANAVFRNSPNIVFTCQDILRLPSNLSPYNITLGIGTFAWQEKDTALAIIRRMWEMTRPGGAMLFTYLPGNPFARQEVGMLRHKELQGVGEMMSYEGYAPSGEIMVIMKKEE